MMALVPLQEKTLESLLSLFPHMHSLRKGHVRRWQATRQVEVPYQELNWPAPWSWSSQPSQKEVSVVFYYGNLANKDIGCPHFHSWFTAANLLWTAWSNLAYKFECDPWVLFHLFPLLGCLHYLFSNSRLNFGIQKLSINICFLGFW